MPTRRRINGYKRWRVAAWLHHLQTELPQMAFLHLSGMFLHVRTGTGNPCTSTRQVLQAAAQQSVTPQKHRASPPAVILHPELGKHDSTSCTALTLHYTYALVWSTLCAAVKIVGCSSTDLNDFVKGRSRRSGEAKTKYGVHHNIKLIPQRFVFDVFN